VANDPRVPTKVQDKLREWGLPKDEFTDNGNWSHQLYIREARRMVGHYVMTENELRKKKPTPESVGMGSYTIDSHNVQRYITPEGHVQNEGDIGVGTNGPYEIAYGSLVPKSGQGANLLVPVAMSASHIAYGSIRMEPVFMILGQSAATAAILAIDGGLPVQKVPYPALRERLLKDGQILTYNTAKTARGIDPKSMPGTTVDDQAAVKTGDWTASTSAGTFVGDGYVHDQNEGKGGKSIRFRATLASPGKYEVRFAYPSNDNRATRVPVTIRHAKGETLVTVDQRKPAPISGRCISLGTFEFGADAEVTVGTAGTTGFVVADAVQWLAVE